METVDTKKRPILSDGHNRAGVRIGGARDAGVTTLADKVT